MSIVDDQVRRLDALLDRYQVDASSQDPSLLETSDAEPSVTIRDDPESSRSLQLKGIIRSLSTTSSARPLLRRHRLQGLLEQLTETHSVQLASKTEDHTDLEWLAAGKAAIQAYGIVLKILLEQTIPLSNGIWYWDDILGSYANTGLYTLQTWPARIWKQSKEVYAEAKEKYMSNISIRESSQQATESLADSWREFYALVQHSVQDRSLIHARTKILSPFALCRSEARRNQTGLKTLRELSATAIGLVLDEGLTFPTLEDDSKTEIGSSSPDFTQDEWRATVAKSVSLLEHVLRNVSTTGRGVADFEDNVFTNVENDPEIGPTDVESSAAATKPSVLNSRLLRILDAHLPEQEQTSKRLASKYGRPSLIVRYWIPGVALLLSGSTILRILANRRAEIRQWIQDLGQTAIDFWSNWVLEPVKKLIGTIRHDEQG